MVMQFYQYRSIVAKTLVEDGKITFVDKRAEAMHLDSRCITVYVLGETPMLARITAIKRLKQIYPEERGYKVPEIGNIEVLAETIIEVVS